MGKIIKLNIDIVSPSQFGLCYLNLGRILKSYVENPKKMIVPIRVHPFDSSRYMLLDGHHSTCIADTLNESNPNSVQIYGWVAKNENDIIEELTEEYYQKNISFNNGNIKERYQLLDDGLIFFDNMPKTIKEMRAEYSELESGASLMNYVFPVNSKI